MIRVLHVLPNFRPAGAERMSVSLMQNLDRSRFEVSAISMFDRFDTELEQTLDAEGIPVWYLGKRPGLDPRMFGRISRVLERLQPDVVHTHRYVLRYALPPMLQRRVPAMVHTVHNLAEREAPWSVRLMHSVGFRRGLVPVAIADEVADSLRRYYGIEGFPLIPNGIPVDAFQRSSLDSEAWRGREGFSPADVLLVCVAGMRPQKNLALLVDSFARGAASDTRAHLLLVGDGELRPDLERRIEAMGLRGRTHLLGVRSDVPEILNAADVFVLSSDWEGNPLSVMEAMAAGRPVISTAVGGVPELVEDGECGLLVPPGDAEALAGAMRRTLDDTQTMKAMGRVAAARAERRFSLKAMTEGYEDLYESRLDKARTIPAAG